MRGGRGRHRKGSVATGTAPWALRRPAGPRPHVRPRARWPRGGAGRRAPARLDGDGSAQLVSQLRAAGRQLPRPRRRPPRPRTRAAQPCTVPTRGLCRRHRHAPPTRWASTAASRSATRWAGRSPSSSGSATRTWSTGSSCPRPRRRSTGPHARACSPEWRSAGASSPGPCSHDRSPWRRRRRSAAGGRCVTHRGGGSRRSPDTTGAGSSRPVGSCAASTRGRGCATRPSRPPSSPRATTMSCPIGRQLALAEAIPGATVRAVGGGHSACTVERGHFVPALVDACMEVAGRAGSTRSAA